MLPNLPEAILGSFPSLVSPKGIYICIVKLPYCLDFGVKRGTLQTKIGAIAHTLWLSRRRRETLKIIWGRWGEHKYESQLSWLQVRENNAVLGLELILMSKLIFERSLQLNFEAELYKVSWEAAWMKGQKQCPFYEKMSPTHQEGQDQCHGNTLLLGPKFVVFCALAICFILPNFGAQLSELTVETILVLCMKCIC